MNSCTFAILMPLWIGIAFNMLLSIFNMVAALLRHEASKEAHRNLERRRA